MLGTSDTMSTSRAIQDGFFVNPAFNVGSEIMLEWIATLVEQDQKRTENVFPHQAAFKKDNLTEFVFCICERLGQPSQVRYLAVEILNRFLLQHVHDLYSHVENLDSSREMKLEEWKSIQIRVRTQLMLRAVSCCQIASKLTSNYALLTTKKVRGLLRELGHKYSFNGIIQSEIRILNTLNHRVLLSTPLEYIETLLVILAQKDVSLNVDSYYKTCLNFLDIVYMKHSQIYENLQSILASRQLTPKKRRLSASLQNDFTLLAAAVITTASYLISNTDTNKVLERLTESAPVSADDVLDFATVLIHELRSESEQ